MVIVPLTVRYPNIPEFASFRESSRRRDIKNQCVALLSESSRAPFSGKSPDGGPDGTRWQPFWYWAYLLERRAYGSRSDEIGEQVQLAIMNTLRQVVDQVNDLAARVETPEGAGRRA
jgi:hypothetical protein